MTQLHDGIKGGDISRRAAMLCQSAEFRLYLDRRCRAKFKMAIDDGTHTEQDARDWLVRACGIGSRAELDHNPEAARRFGYVVNRFKRWREGRRGEHGVRA